jgi:hypothetical protein
MRERVLKFLSCPVCCSRFVFSFSSALVMKTVPSARFEVVSPLFELMTAEGEERLEEEGETPRSRLAAMVTLMKVWVKRERWKIGAGGERVSRRSGGAFLFPSKHSGAVEKNFASDPKIRYYPTSAAEGGGRRRGATQEDQENAKVVCRFRFESRSNPPPAKRRDD